MTAADWRFRVAVFGGPLVGQVGLILLAQPGAGIAVISENALTIALARQLTFPRAVQRLRSTGPDWVTDQGPLRLPRPGASMISDDQQRVSVSTGFR